MNTINKRIIYTIGHSNRKLDELTNVLIHHGIKVLIDVRHFPRSRRNPQFNKETLENKLTEKGIGYLWMEKLGGFRKEGYEEYMKTREFRDAVDNLQNTANNKTSAVMCAELEWINCHRRYIASFLEASGWEVIHIYDENKTVKHEGIQFSLF